MRIRSWVWVVALIATWAAVGYDFYDRHRIPDIPEFDAKQSAEYIQSYGHTDTNCNVTVNGDAFWNYRNDYQLSIACYFADGSKDLMDAQLSGVAMPHEITHGEILGRVHTNKHLAAKMFGGWKSLTSNMPVSKT